MATLPDNKNFLSPLGFTFNIKKTPNVNYFVQSASLPDISLGQIDVPTPFVKMPVPGDHMTFSPLTISFRVDEDMENYNEIFTWITSLGFPDNFGQYNRIAARTNRFGGTQDPAAGNGIYSDASLVILNSARAPVREFVFRNLFPVSLSDLSFDVRNSDVDYIDATATFAYETFTLNSIT